MGPPVGRCWGSACGDRRVQRHKSCHAASDGIDLHEGPCHFVERRVRSKGGARAHLALPANFHAKRGTRPSFLARYPPCIASMAASAASATNNRGHTHGTDIPPNTRRNSSSSQRPGGPRTTNLPDQQFARGQSNRSLTMASAT